MDAKLHTFLKQFQHLEIQLEEITKATNNFNDDENCIGRGGFGKVYKGEVSHSEGRSMAAIKRLNLNPENKQGTLEFLNEITMLFRYKHKNLIPLLGFCYEGKEMILVYELASHGSLEQHLNSPDLTWTQRLKICLDAAKGLRYLHDPRETHQRLLHRDVKSANILIDDQWNGKVSDFGLSIMGSANEHTSLVVTVPVGTAVYCDPQYVLTHTLTKESDVYSFGVVLFEVLCGKRCYTYSDGRVQQNFVPAWIKSYEDKKLDDVIFKDPNIEPMHQSVLKRFSGIAYQCLEENRKNRPEMAEVVTELERALSIHELLQNEEFIGKWNEQLYEYREITKTAEPPLDDISEEDLMALLHKGVILNGGKTYFSLNKKGEHYEMIAIAEYLESEFERRKWSPRDKLRFSLDTHGLRRGIFNTRVKAQFLSPGVAYTVNLVFKFEIPDKGRKCYDLISVKYKLQGETESSISYLACESEDGWWTAELYQFSNHRRNIDLTIMFEGIRNLHSIKAEGIEFRPLEEVEDIVKNQTMLDSGLDANWEQNLPTDYKDIMKWSTDSVQWTTEKEAYSIIREGFLMGNNGSIWFFLDKNGKKCHIRSATVVLESYVSVYEKSKLFSRDSRFGEVVQLDYPHLQIQGNIISLLVSSETTYATYLVYKLPDDQSGFYAPLEVKVMDIYGKVSNRPWYIYLVSPQTPVIEPKDGQKTHNPLNRPKIKALPQKRDDGWMEVQIWEFQAATTTEMIRMDLILNPCDKKNLNGLIIEGIEFRSI